MIFDWQPHTCLLYIFGFLFFILLLYTIQNSNTIQLPINRISKVLITTTTTTFSSSTKASTITPSESLVSGSLLNSTPSEAFVTFTNNNPKYLALLTNALDSVHHFSTRPIIVYGIDVDLDLDIIKYPRLIKRRINQKECGPSIYFCKIYAIVHSQIDYGVYIEADTLVNWNVDILFDVLHRWPYSLPLAPRHPNDPGNYHNFTKEFNVNSTARKTPYIHGHISWNYRAYPFLEQALTLMRQGHFIGANYDETGINVLLWKAKANHTLCKIGPYFSFLSAYESNEKTCEKYCHTAFVFIHGSKSASVMHNILERLKNHTGSPFIQTSREGFHYLNETQYTCCYPDSQPSPIHPLLCQHTK